MRLGTDPEFFIKDKDGKAVSASEVFGVKKEPWRPGAPSVPFYDGLGRLLYHQHEIDKKTGTYKWRSATYGPNSIFRDGFVVEVNVAHTGCRETLAAEVAAAIADIKKRIKEVNEGYTLSSDPTVEVDLEYISKLPEDVKMFGCDPSFNAYAEDEVRIELNGATHPFRYAGGHMHFGVDDSFMHPIICPSSPQYKEKKDVFLLIRMLDLLIGVPLSVIFNDSLEFKRRQFYGKAGEFRFQKWGIEYRVPSSRVWNHAVIASMAFGVGRSVINNFEKWKAFWPSLKKSHPDLEGKIIGAINHGVGGEDLLQEVGDFCGKDLVKYLKDEGKKVFKLMELSLDSSLKDGRNGLESNLHSRGKSSLIPRGSSYSNGLFA